MPVIEKPDDATQLLTPERSLSPSVKTAFRRKVADELLQIQ